MARSPRNSVSSTARAPSVWPTAQNPIGLIVPCHRVIGSDGSLTGFGGGLPMKKALLAHEAMHANKEGDLFAVR